MKVSDHVLLKFRCHGVVVLVRVSLVNGVTWQWVAVEALRLYGLMARDSMRHCPKMRISNILSPSNEVLDLKQRILYYDVRAMSTHPRAFTLVAEGPWVILANEQLVLIHSFLRNSRDTNALIRVNKRFQKLFSSDYVWRRIPVLTSVWAGNGNGGDEESIWNKIRDDAGLEITHGHRLRWMSHNTSRLKLFYGSLQLSLIDYFFSRSSPARTVLVLGNGRDRDLTMSFMAKLHYLVPESVTAFHLSRACMPLLPGAVLVDLEPSPPDSRSRNHTLDPGTPMECSGTDTNFAYRRLGDARLSFVGLNLAAASTSRYGLDYGSYYALTAKTKASILLLEYNSFRPEVMATELAGMWAALQYHYGATAAGNAAAWERHKEQRFLTSTTPVLVCLYVDWTEWAPPDTVADEFLRSESFALGVRGAVQAVHTLLHTLTSNAQHRHRPRSWYIQPVDAHAPQRKLSGGVFAGINWLLRALGQTLDVNDPKPLR